MRRLIMLGVVLSLMMGCAIYRPNDYCHHNDVMIIDVGDDAFQVTCEKKAVEKARIRIENKVMERCPSGTRTVIHILKDDEMVYKMECRKIE